MKGESKETSTFAIIFYILLVVFGIGFGFYFYQEKYDFYLPKKDVNMLSGSEYTIFLLSKNGVNDKNAYTYETSDKDVVNVDSKGTDFSSSVMVTLSNGYKDKKREAEGIHIYNNNIYFGSTRGSNIFDIGYYE